jgi:hypothetical protein
MILPQANILLSIYPKLLKDLCFSFPGDLSFQGFVNEIFKLREKLQTCFILVIINIMTVSKHKGNIKRFYILKFTFVFWDVLPCKIIVDRRFRGTCCHHYQGDEFYILMTCFKHCVSNDLVEHELNDFQLSTFLTSQVTLFVHIHVKGG